VWVYRKRKSFKVETYLGPSKCSQTPLIRHLPDLTNYHLVSSWMYFSPSPLRLIRSLLKQISVFLVWTLPVNATVNATTFLWRNTRHRSLCFVANTGVSELLLALCHSVLQWRLQTSFLSRKLQSFWSEKWHIFRSELAFPYVASVV